MQTAGQASASSTSGELETRSSVDPPGRADRQGEDLSNLGEDVAHKGVFTWKTILDFHMYKHF